MPSANYWVVIPAAGTGSRMQSDVPKQYLKLCGKTILEHTAEHFIRHPKIKGIIVVLNSDDPCWQLTSLATNDQVRSATGGSERCHSVLNGLTALSDLAKENDWVLVHDAARPCLSADDIDHLLSEVADHPVGGILAVPVRDTMKRANDSNEISETIERNGLWHALTPQMFRYGKLVQALTEAIKNQEIVTDEAQAVELTGVKPLLIQGQTSNIKITQMGDIELAEFYLRSRGIKT